MCRRLLPSIALCTLLCRSGAAEAPQPEGIPRQLAVERARQVSDLRYHLVYELITHADHTAAQEEIHFRMSQPANLLLDFRTGTVEKLAVNGAAAATTIDNGHLLLPGASLRSGENVVSVSFSASVAPAGRAVTRFEDKDDGSEYVYTLFVPMDASMAFPCFDQPDLKGRFQLDLTAPQDWTVVSNSLAERNHTSGDRRTTYFEETRPISTYLFAFAAGPFENIHPTAGLPNVYVRRSQARRASAEVPQIQSVTAQATQFLSQYFAQPFPFSKYEMVLLPGFAYGGMEHAGATFLREESMIFRSAPTETDRFNRSITVVHELTHQWFGDFVTMRWFDDLWLKEGFAQYMAYRTMASLEPGENVWKRFYQGIKPAAYGIDETKGTTPVYQDIPNLKDAKSAYGAIVYSKAPGLLRQLAFLLGDDAFRNGLRLYLKEHAYANAEWKDLVGALEQASGQSLKSWAGEWIRRRGMPIVRVTWSCGADAQLRHLTLTQSNVLGEAGVWPIATQVLLGYADGHSSRLRAQFSTATAVVPDAAGKACPSYVFANDQDYGYGMFLLDDRSRDYLMPHFGTVTDLFERTMYWGSLWDAVRFTELAPRRFLDLEVAQMNKEHDEALVQWLGSRSAVALHDYVDAHTRAELNSNFEQIALDGMLHSPEQGMRIVWFRNLRAVANTDAGLKALRGLLDGTVKISGVELRPLDRWTLVTALVSHGGPEADAVLAAEKERDPSGDGLKYAYMAAAAKPESASKRWYFNDYLQNPSRPEDWVEQSLGAFNYWNESEVTAAFLKPALDALPQVKQQRKIFFLLAWLNAFISGQSSVAADREVHQWLATAQLDHDLQLKVLQVVDDLDRTVRIRQRFP